MKGQLVKTETTLPEVTALRAADPRWKDLYRIGGIAAIVEIIVIVLAIAAFVIWPYAPNTKTTEDTFRLLQSDPLGGVMALDIFLFLGNLCSLLLFLALYGSLKSVNESYSLIALALGLVSVILLIPSRPILELLALSAKYAAATTDVARSEYLAAGTALLALFDGINWFMSTLLGGISLILSSWLMLKSNLFSKATAYVGLATNVALCGFFLPVIGTLLLFLTLPGYIIWYVLLARRFFQMGRSV